ncbi:TetR family transcriptional regulator [Acinetobacter sp. YH12063]|uniref:TetR family transcriptional regulator n=1 Tax=Acinetobacter sp. YH12063 TaxID=2601061 RepID=UPI0015D371D2|nr:TetR family transcriptional regulator [Acinetobacter sp. YH12063]
MSIREERKQQSRKAILDAALALSTTGRSFSSLSLREISRHVGLVPAAFYRHFQDMNELGLELVDQMALHLRNVLNQLSQQCFQAPDARTRQSLDYLFHAVEQFPEAWMFLIAERWGGSASLRQAITREFNFLSTDLAHALAQVEATQHIQSEQDLKVLGQILFELALSWAMQWIDLHRHVDLPQRTDALQQFRRQAQTQVQLLFRGILHWDRSLAQIADPQNLSP